MLTFSNGYEIACGMSDNSIIIFDTTTNQIKNVLMGHTSKVTSLALLNNLFLASGAQDLTLKIWNLTAMSIKSWFKVNPYNPENVNALTSLNNGFIAAGTDFGYVYLYDLNGYVKEISRFSNINSLSVLKNGYLAIGLSSGVIEIWDVNSLNQTASLNGHTNSVNSLVVLKNGYLASGSDDKTIKIWDTDLFKEVITLYEHQGSVSSLIVLSNGFLVSGSRDNTIKIWSFS